MEIVNASGLIFSPDDHANWDAFLNTQTGQRLLPKLAEFAPRLLSKGDTNEILIRNGQLIGFHEIVQAMLELRSVPQSPTQPAEAYPSLDDDDAWRHLESQ